MVSVSALDRLVPLGAVFPVSLLLGLLSIAVGYWIGKNRRRRTDTMPERPIGAVVGAMLGLLALMLAFTFGIAASRYEARKQLLLDDVNAILTAVRRSELLPEPHRSESRALLMRYVRLRVEIARDPSRIREAMAEAENLHRKLWAVPVALAATGWNSQLAALYVEALNELMVVHTNRSTVAVQYRIPDGVWYVLVLLTVMCMIAVGFQFGASGRASIVVILWLVIALSVVVTLIAHLDQPTEGGMRVSQQPMLDLERRLEHP